MEFVSGMLYHPKQFVQHLWTALNSRYRTPPSDVNVTADFNCAANLLFLTCTCTVVFAPHAPVRVYSKSGGVPKWKRKNGTYLSVTQGVCCSWDCCDLALVLQCCRQSRCLECRRVKVSTGTVRICWLHCVDLSRSYVWSVCSALRGSLRTAVIWYPLLCMCLSAALHRVDWDIVCASILLLKGTTGVIDSNTCFACGSFFTVVCVDSLESLVVRVYVLQCIDLMCIGLSWVFWWLHCLCWYRL
jgi:hypothetical protein